MADGTAVDDSSPIVQNLPSEEAGRGCAGHKIAAWCLAALIAVAVAGAVGSLLPRGRRRRGTRRRRRPRPWDRFRTGWPPPSGEDGDPPEDDLA